MHPLRSRSAGNRTRRPGGGSTAPSLAGLTLCRALRATGGGPPWRARQTATGYDVVLRPLPASVAPADFDDLPEHPHLAVPTVLAGADGCTYAVNRHAPHGGLDALLARRGALAPGEVATVVLAVGRALAAMHAHRRAHGSVVAGAVLLDSGLRPLLDASVCRPAGGPAGLAAEDVRALGVLAVELLGSEVPQGLRACLSAATDDDPGLRPAATELVREFVATVPPEALRLTAGSERAVPAPLRMPSAPRRRHMGARSPRWRPVVLPVLAAVALLALAVLAGAAWARVSEGSDAVPQALHGPARVVAPAAVPPPDWVQVLDDLDTARAAAFANADEHPLSFVDAPRSPAMARDVAAVRALADRRLQAHAFRIVVLGVQQLSVERDVAVLDITDRRVAYDLVGVDGSVVSAEPARAPMRWQVELVRVGRSWLIREVRSGWPPLTAGPGAPTGSRHR
jgi:hypothetical protein